MATKRYFEDRGLAIAYKKFRNELPLPIVKRILNFLEESFVPSECIAIDVGCGPGQSTRPIAPYLKKVIGIDISEEQIRAANEEKLPNTEFHVGSCYSIPVANQSVELVLTVSAFHWFEAEKFFKEVDRVLRPNGILVIAGNPPVNSSIIGHDEEWQELRENMKEITKNYLDSSIVNITAIYDNIKLPYRMNIRDESVILKVRESVSHIISRITTTSHFANFVKSDSKNAKIYLDKLEIELMKIANATTVKPDEAFLTAEYKHLLIMSRKE